METTPKPGHVERERTDKSLADERSRTDNELSRRGAVLEKTADEALTRTQGHAAELLDRAREREDESLRRLDSTANAPAELIAERRREDDGLRDQAEVATTNLADERSARRRALGALLALEREQTDHYLVLERDSADDEIGSRDDFLGMVSHDARNLRGGIAMSAGSLIALPGDDATRAATAREGERIQRYAARMNRLVDDLLDVASIQAGRLAVKPELRDVTEVVRETLDLFRPTAAKKSVSLRTDVTGAAIVARYDRERILQVLANLVGNALKFTQKGGTVAIGVELVDREARLRVMDTGPGIAAAEIPAVFERFWQAAKPDRTGLGLGLYIARSIVEAHGGRIWAVSDFGRGSTFYFTLPGAGPPR